MRRPDARYAMRIAAGVLLALLASGIARPTGALAGCLHLHGSGLGRGAAHLDRLALAGALSLPIEDATPSPPASPCAGLRCSSDPAPGPSPVPIPAPRTEPWGDLAGRTPPADPSSAPLPLEAAALRPTHGGPPPFHPPR
jgi:hypothetical protein